VGIFKWEDKGALLFSCEKKIADVLRAQGYRIARWHAEGWVESKRLRHPINIEEWKARRQHLSRVWEGWKENSVWFGKWWFQQR